VGFSIAGQLLMKWAALHTIGSPSLLNELPRLILALGVYSLGILSWIFALRRIRLSIAYSVASLNYVGILFGSYYWLDEQISLLQIAGMFLILTGVAFVASRPFAMPQDHRSQALKIRSSGEVS